MTDVERAKHDAAIKLQKLVLRIVTDKVAGWSAATILHDPDALAVIDAISLHVIATIEHYLQQPIQRVGNGE